MSDTLDMTGNNKSKTTLALIAPRHEYVSRISSTTFNARETKKQRKREIHRGDVQIKI